MGSNPVGRTIFLKSFPHPGGFLLLSVIKTISSTHFQKVSVE